MKYPVGTVCRPIRVVPVRPGWVTYASHYVWTWGQR